MGKIIRNRVVGLLSAVVMMVNLHGGVVQAGSAMFFAYSTDRGVRGTTDVFADAFDISRRHGGTVTFQRDYQLGPADYDTYIYIPENMTLIIPKGIWVAVKNIHIWLDGTIQVEGTLDVETGKGMIEGTGDIATGDGGKLIRQLPYIEKSGEICLRGSEIREGQPLSASFISSETIAWGADVAGTWSFAEPDRIPGPGTGLYDVVFTPKNQWMYQTVTLSSCGQVTVRKKDVDPEPENTGAVTGKPSDKGNTAQKTETKKQEDTFVENEGVRTPVIITQMVSRPSTIYTVQSSFRKKRPRVKRAVRSGKGRRIRLRWSSVSGKKGYEIQYAIRKSMKGAKKKYVKKTTVTLRGLKKRRTYYLRVRAYKGKKKKRTYTRWSPVVRLAAAG